MSRPIYQGLDYAAVWATLNGIFKPDERAAAFFDIRAMESAAMPLLNKHDE